jgi:hypothetical protein
MKLLMFLFLASNAFADVKVEAFIIQLKDRSLHVLAPQKKRDFYPVIVENLSLSDYLGKFSVDGKLLKYVAVKPGKSETVEIENKTGRNVIFTPVSPAFQEVELIFGKRSYEIPSKE